MHTLAWHAWGVLGELATVKLVTREMALLVILAACLLVFRTLRERSLMVWIVGWTAYFASHHAVLAAGPYVAAEAQSEFVLAVCLFVAGTFIYANARDWLAPLLGIGIALIGFAAVRASLWPNSPTLRFALELSYRLLAIFAVFALLRFHRTRKEIGPWVLSAGLLLLHLDSPAFTTHLPAESGVLFDFALGLGMLMVVFDESRLHTRRLATLNALTTGISRVSQDETFARKALHDLADLMDSRAAWFRTTDEHRLTIFQQVGL